MKNINKPTLNQVIPNAGFTLAAVLASPPKSDLQRIAFHRSLTGGEEAIIDVLPGLRPLRRALCVFCERCVLQAQRITDCSKGPITADQM